MLDQIITIIAAKKEVGSETLSPDTELEDLGFDSLDIMDLMFDVESCLKLRLPSDLPATEYAELVTIRDIERLIVNHGKDMAK